MGKGDYGFTDFIGTAVAYKSSWQAEACGSVDELNAFLGEAWTRIQNEEIRGILFEISEDLFALGANIANTMMSKPMEPCITPFHVHRIEDRLSDFQNRVNAIRHFVVPIGPPEVTILNISRSVCRRAERQMVKFMKDRRYHDHVNPLILAYLNRLGDLLFTLARFMSKEKKAKEIFWSRKNFKRSEA